MIICASVGAESDAAAINKVISGLRVIEIRHEPAEMHPYRVLSDTGHGVKHPPIRDIELRIKGYGTWIRYPPRRDIE